MCETEEPNARLQFAHSIASEASCSLLIILLKCDTSQIQAEHQNDNFDSVQVLYLDK